MLDCPWTALYVDTGKIWNEETKETITRYLGLARKLGADVETTHGPEVEEALLRYARDKGVTQIVLGKNDRPAWKHFFRPSFAESLIRNSGDIDILVVRPEKDSKTALPQHEAILPAMPPAGEWIWVLAIFSVVTLFGLWLNPLTGYLTISHLYLLSVVLAAFRLSRWPILALACASALAWDFLFIPPRFTFYIGETHDALMFGMMFVVALVTGHLTSKLREREAMERRRERRTATMLAFTQALSLNAETSEALSKAIKMIGDLYEANIAVFQRDTGKSLKKLVALGSTFRPDDKEWGVAQWCFLNRQSAGRFTDTLSTARALYVPLYTQILNVGVLAIEPRDGQAFDLAERTLLDNFASQLAFALEKDHVVVAMQQAELAERSSHLQKTLLDSVSHELKTPLAGLRSATEMLERGTALQQPTLVGEIRLATNRLQGVVDHLLDMTRLQTGSIQAQLEWCEVQEIFQDLQRHFRELYPQRELQVTIRVDVLILTDPVLVEKAVWNLLHNAALYCPEEALIELSASMDDGEFVIRVRDHGPGIPEDELPHIFKKFYRGSTATTGGTGLGLSITRGFLEAMGGSISVVNLDSGGVLFTLRLRPETKAASLLETLP
jgi:two-component system sensor histidine kinase KdpD